MIFQSIALMLMALQAPSAQAERLVTACTAANSIRTDALAINRDPDDFVGRCVTVEGPASGIALFSGIEGLYLSQRFGSDGNFSKSGALHRIGLYSQDNGIRSSAAAATGMRHLRVTGRVDTCKQMREKAKRESTPQAIIMMSGYCHYYGGPVIRASEWSADPSVRYERLTGERNAERYGNLVEAPADWPERAKFLALARDFRSALATDDRALLAELHGTELDTTNEHDVEMLAYLLERPDSSFADLRRGSGARPVLFINRYDAAKGYREGEDRPAGTICYCRTADCSQSWPITFNDAVNSLERPFACTTVEPHDWTKRKVALQTPVGPPWLAEPVRTTFRRQ